MVAIRTASPCAHYSKLRAASTRRRSVSTWSSTLPNLIGATAGGRRPAASVGVSAWVRRPAVRRAVVVTAGSATRRRLAHLAGPRIHEVLERLVAEVAVPARSWHVAVRPEWKAGGAAMYPGVAAAERAPAMLLGACGAAPLDGEHGIGIPAARRSDVAVWSLPSPRAVVLSIQRVCPLARGRSQREVSHRGEDGAQSGRGRAIAWEAEAAR
jgi:hypothetical protein